MPSIARIRSGETGATAIARFDGGVDQHAHDQRLAPRKGKAACSCGLGSRLVAVTRVINRLP
jgi:hypothetical protein